MCCHSHGHATCQPYTSKHSFQQLWTHWAHQCPNYCTELEKGEHLMACYICNAQKCECYVSESNVVFTWGAIQPDKSAFFRCIGQSNPTTTLTETTQVTWHEKLQCNWRVKSPQRVFIERTKTIRWLIFWPCCPCDCWWQVTIGTTFFPKVPLRTFYTSPRTLLCLHQTSSLACGLVSGQAYLREGLE